MFDDFVAANGMDWSPSMMNRMSQRARRIFPAGEDIVAGKSVLDLAARDGRWSWAAQRHGAKSTIGIEGRRKSVAEGAKAMQPYAESNRHRMIVADVYDGMRDLARLGWNFDVVLCLGFIYHVYDHWGLMQAMSALKPRVIVVDGEMDPGAELGIRITPEWTNHPNNAVSARPVVPVGHVTLGTMELLAKCAGYSLAWQDWSELDDPLGCDDYVQRKRYTCILRLDEQSVTSAAPSPGPG
jgi:hypothetical protein